ncbi:MAG: type IX secretion system membrane protein PorP/SprF [Sporocytophaga sp.]|nr:type IX secretion system membrane protein PorP/SprF [Sporocytophaga sp.]
MNLISLRNQFTLIICLILSAFTFEVKCQDIQFSQFYAASLYLNPAFAGSAHADRITFHQRLQWPSLDAKYTTSYLSYDRYFEKYKSGVGAYILKDWQGKNYINSTEAALQYSYEIGLSENLALRPAIQFGLISRSIDYTHLKYPDQFDDQGLTGNPTNDPHYNSNRKTFANIGSGMVLYSRKIWVSYAGSHLNRPNQSNWNESSHLPLKHSITAGYRIEAIKGDSKNHMGYVTQSLYLIPTFQYKFQGKSDQLDLGVYAFYNEYVLGVWYRGIPVKKYNSRLQNNESMIILAGWRIKQFRLTYSYDFIVSKLRPARTAGAHELNITYIFNKKKAIKKLKVLPCPEF